MTTTRLLKRFVGEDCAQDLIEYALLVTFIALAVVTGLQSLGVAVNGQYGVASSVISGAATPDADGDDGGNGGGNPGNPDPGTGTPGNGNPGTGNPGNGTGS